MITFRMARPTTDFLIALGAYSLTGMPSEAGASIAAPARWRLQGGAGTC